MRSSLYNTKKPEPNMSSKQMEEQMYNENEELLNALGGNVNRMKGMASTLHREAEEHNEILERLQSAVAGATVGVNTTIRNLKGVFEKSNWKYMVGVMAIVFFILYLIYSVA
ncbi:blocked early in transport 1 [Angomonas deanei]|uniref:t-SNARE coiled-coil homology domain-containing protein n=1 Tax=Angomonas deanei TaxID=59799 RepID=S9VI81_9TRYP|nr:blocked early in transport 1 [Angomonas deanei]EPY42502.1 blocked early in transport 1 [Angomonas deanei]CAD2217135.1 hypothetical protein, conserved [Angomonas deanei]|eukprot:EPY37442.1 blocked early in transport 1 [Angomonas deanei]